MIEKAGGDHLGRLGGFGRRQLGAASRRLWN